MFFYQKLVIFHYQSDAVLFKSPTDRWFSRSIELIVSKTRNAGWSKLRKQKNWNESRVMWIRLYFDHKNPDKLNFQMKLDYMMASPSLTFSGWFSNFQKFQNFQPSDWLRAYLKTIKKYWICLHVGWTLW